MATETGQSRDPKVRLQTLVACQIVTQLLFSVAPGVAAAGSIDVAVQQNDGQPLAGAAVTVRRSGGGGPANGPAATAPWVMDQQGLAFTPEVIVVPIGGSVTFPNSDRVSHQVYSFSPAKRFQLPLYRGRAYPPTRFDTAGIITLGCNIHDNMIGWILVTDAPWFGQTNAKGQWAITGLVAGYYEVSVWHPRLRDDARLMTSHVRLEAAGAAETRFRSAQPMRPAPLTGKAREWDY